MDWGQVLTIIFGIAGFMSIFMFLVNKRIDDLRQDMDRRLDDMDKKFESMERRMDRLERRLDRIEDLLLKALGVESKKEN
ncbi:hypothetical protein JCM9492_11200 [Aquifex pyrophilus]